MSTKKHNDAQSISIIQTLAAQEIIELEPFDFSDGIPLMQALKNRRSTHSYSSTTISNQQLSSLLWAANGVNRQVTFKGRVGMRTAPSAKNHQEIEIYVFLASGIYLYDAVKHRLVIVREGDYRAQCGMQAFFAEALLAICLVADFSKMGKYDEKKRAFYSGIDTGYVSQNIYLFCASHGLATTACGLIDRKSLYRLLKLGDAKAMLSHPVGVPANP